VSSPLTETLSGNGDHSAFQFSPNWDHHRNTDPEIKDIAKDIAKDHLLQHPADSLLHMPAQLADNSLPAVTDGAHPAHAHFDGNQPASFKFADDGSAHPGAVPSDAPTLTALTSDPSGAHGPATRAHATDDDTSVQSAPANNGHHWGADPEINFASIPQNHSLEHPADNLPHTLAQHDDGPHPADAPVDVNELPSFKFGDNGSGHPDTGPDGAHTAHSQVDGDQLDTFKFADDGSAHPGTVVPHDSPTLTALSSDSSGTHGPAAPALANTVNVPGTVLSDPASDKFIFGNNFGHDTVADVKPDMTEIDQTVSTDIQHLLDTAHETNAVSTLDPNHATAPQDMTKVLPHYQGDFHFA